MALWQLYRFVTFKQRRCENVKSQQGNSKGNGAGADVRIDIVALTSSALARGGRKEMASRKHSIVSV